MITSKAIKKFVQDVNSSGMCGRSDWRLPTFRELHSLVRLGASPTIDNSYFPNTTNYFFWSNSPAAIGATHAWLVGFHDGTSLNYQRSAGLFVRLVRVGT